MDKIHLICNAHLDPVWLWEWEEGAAEVLSTFRTVADFCEEFDGFVFNHNEAILYKWVEEYDIDLFNRIQVLVKKGKWNIMGGWHLQPDCNMPSGESIVRHILTGKKYFKDKFGVECTTSLNFDSFGHSRGLVQILKKCGYDSYIICRSGPNADKLPSDDFIWTGYEGSQVIVHKSSENYNSINGKALEKLEEWIDSKKDIKTGLFLWGVGDHGGGPSRKDIKDINSFMDKTCNDTNIIHSKPENYFDEVSLNRESLPRYSSGLNPVAQGCYTSQIRVKQKHRQLENDLYMVEKMLSNTNMQCGMAYPKEELDSAFYDLMTSEFHDALPGTAIKKVEDATLRILEHGLEIASRLKARAFFKLASGQEKVKDGQSVILVYNPHPYKVKKIIDCELVLPVQNWEDEFSYPIMHKGDTIIPCQAEQELSNFRMDWRKHAVFEAELEPSQMSRFNVSFQVLKKKPEPKVKQLDGKIILKNSELEVVINCKTGLIDKYVVDNVNYLKGNAFDPTVMEDTYNSWGSYSKYNNIVGKFTLMSKEEGNNYSGLLNKTLDSIRIIEDGEVRTVVEALFIYNHSTLVMTYFVPKSGTEVQLQVRVFWCEKDKLLKLNLPTKFQTGKYIGETMYGHEELESNGEEVVAQKWVGITDGSKMFTIANDCIYGSSCNNGEIGLTLLRSPGYSTTNFLGRIAVPQDRFTERMDQGERLYNFWIKGRNYEESLNLISREALCHNEKPYALAYCPSGLGEKLLPLIMLEDSAAEITAFKKDENSDDYIIRVFEPTGISRSMVLRIPTLKIKKEIKLKGFEVKTLRVKCNGSISEEEFMCI